MPLATDKQWVKQYGQLPWWRESDYLKKLLKQTVESSTAIKKDYAGRPVEALKKGETIEFGPDGKRGILKKQIVKLVKEHPGWNKEQIKAVLNGEEIEEQSEEKVFAQADQPEFTRSLTSYERKVDFAVLDSETKKLATQGTDRIKRLLAESRDKLMALIASRYKAGSLSAKFVLDLELRGLGQLIPTLREVLGTSFRLGQREASKELKKTFARYASDWEEQDHPREDDGKFAPKGGGGGRSSEAIEINGWQAERRVGDVKEGSRLGEFFTEHEEVANRLAAGSGSVRSVRIRLEKPLVIPGKDGLNFEHFDSVELDDILKSAGIKYVFPDAQDEEVWRHIDSGGRKLVNVLRRAGYDGIRFPEFIGGKEQITTLVFDKEIAKLSHSYQVKLDPTEQTYQDYASDWEEQDHPREEDGKFAPKGGGNEGEKKIDSKERAIPSMKSLKGRLPKGAIFGDALELEMADGSRKIGAIVRPVGAGEFEMRKPSGEKITFRVADVRAGRILDKASGPRYTEQNCEKAYQVKLDPTGLPPEKALEFFERKAILWGADIRQPLLGQVKNILFDGIKQGTGLRDLIARIGEAYLPWLGDPDQAIDEIMLTPYRLETLVRTNVTEALNEGRKAQFQDAVDDGFVIGLQYSAILDARTTEVCRHLDEKIFPSNSPDLDRLTPPRHFSCRSVLVPVTRMEGPVQYITQSQIAKGIELSGKGFREDGEAREYDFNEEEHPRVPAGEEDGGQFAPKGSDGASNAKSEDAIRAIGVGKERTFVNADGSPVDDATQARINALGIPPAWTGVQVSADPQSPLQAIGYDASGKEQPRYSKQWTADRDAAKHLRVAALAQDGYKKMVAGVASDLKKGVEEAVVMSLVLSTAMRIGGESKKAYGATTLQAQHLSVSGDMVHFDFPGKSGKHWEGTIRDEQLAKQISTRLAGKSGTDRVFAASDSKVNKYLKQYGKMSAKDVRTLQGTSVAMKELKKLGEPKTVKEAKSFVKIVSTKVSEHLRNTPATAKKHYINPAVWSPIQAKFGIQVAA